MGQQIATYNNKVIELVPGYDLKDPSPNPGTITVTKDSVIHGTYASYSSGPTVQGMYIKDYSIGDGQGEYANNQLVAMKDLDYRYLVPNGIDSTSPTYEEKLSTIGCVVSSNSSRTINKGDNYSTRLTPKSEYSKVPAGCIKVQTGVDAQTGEPIWGRTLQTWSRTAEVQINLSAQDITGNLKIEFTESCVYQLTVQKKVGNTDLGSPITREQTCEDRIDLNEFTGTETGLTYSNITDINGNEVTIEQEGNRFCGDTTLYVNYVVNKYTITSNINNNCINLQLTSNGQPVTSNTIVHGSQLTIKLTPGQGKRNIGEGSITMEGYSPDFRWNNYKPNIEHSISSVTGNIVITANTCGQDDTYSVNVKWVNIDDEDNPQIISQHSYIVNITDSINAEYYRNDSDYAPDNTEYRYVGMTPPQGTIITESTEEIAYKYKHIYEVSFTTGPDSGITINQSTPVQVLHGETITVNNVYTVATGYETVTQTHTGSVDEITLDDGDVKLRNITSNVKVNISASQIPSYTVYFNFDNVNAGTIKINGYTRDAWEVVRGTNVGTVLCEFNEGYAFNGAEITQGEGTFNPNPPTNPFDVKDVHSDVYVTIHTTYTPPPVETYRVTYELNGEGIQLKKDGAIVPSGTTFDDVEAGSCSEIEYVLTDGYQFGGAISSVDSIEPTVDTTNKTVEVCPTEDVTITLSTWRPTITYDIYVDGAKIDTQTQKVAIGGTASLQYPKSNTEDYINPPTVRSNDPNLTARVVKNTNRSYTITGTPVTQDATISLYLVTKSEYTVTFKVYKDGTLDSSAGWTSNYTEGETFDNEIFPYDDSAYEIDDVTSQELTVDYNYGDSGEIIISTETPITENATVEIYLNSIPQKEVDTVTFRASEMDAMGGVAFQAYVTYIGGAPETINNQNAFLVTYTGDDGSHSNENPDVVQVYDYNFGIGSTVNYPKVSGTDNVYQKCRLNLENTSTSPTSREVTVIWNGHSHTFTGRDAITQRGEQYGYYTDIDSGDNTAALDTKLTSNSWKSSFLVDYGDSVKMYETDGYLIPSDLKGNDIYNKDITPYYVTGTYIGKNPLRHLDNKKTFVGSGQPADYNKINPTGYNEHYHTTWNENVWNRVDAYYKGLIFKYDGISTSSEFCGGYESSPCSENICECTPYAEYTTNTLEAISVDNDETTIIGNRQAVSYDYYAYYTKPKHNYGRDSISYYHIGNADYRSEVIESPFKDENLSTLEFSYPVHINTYDEEVPIRQENITSGDIGKIGAGFTSYILDTIRWNERTDYGYSPDDSTYTTYYNQQYPAYYDYNNKVRLINIRNPYNEEEFIRSEIQFDKYQNSYYKNSAITIQAEDDLNNVVVGNPEYSDDLTRGPQTGRIIDLYTTLMSPETLIRPIQDSNGTKFAVLSNSYSDTNYTAYDENYQTVDVDSYIKNNGFYGRTRYISGQYWNNKPEYATSKNLAPLTTTDDALNGMDINKYPYTISGTNVDYLNAYTNGDYQEISSRDDAYDDQQGWKFKHEWYNLKCKLSFQQYRNKDDEIEEGYYLHNSYRAKYVTCTGSLDTAYYDYFYGGNIPSDASWEDDIVREGIINITKDNNYSYTIETEQHEGANAYTGCSRGTKEYYHGNQSESLSSIYTNANYISIYFNENNIQTSGLGKIKLVVTKASDGSEVELIEDVNLSNPLVIYYDQNTNNDKLKLDITVYTNCKNHDSDISKEYVRTGGGKIRIEGCWLKRKDGVMTYRYRNIIANIGGSCGESNDSNPNSSGSKLSWANLNSFYFDYYYDSDEHTYKKRDFTNSGNKLIVKQDSTYNV